MVGNEDSPIQPIAHARVRILGTANRLFYDEGVHSVGVDRIIAESGVTKATFYKYYRSKELLMVAYLELRDNYTRELVHSVYRETNDPLERIRGLASAIAAEARKPDFRGCPFINATAQFNDPSHPVRQAITRHRQWYTDVIRQLFADAGHPRPADATDDYFLARDGAYASANLGDTQAALDALDRAMDRLVDQTEQARRSNQATS